jgi:pantoate--beta-alanine ligase
MRTVRTVVALRAELAAAPRPVGLVPTMGALHEGHLSLIRAARRDCATVVTSLFVNPTQFSTGEDLGSYPRDEARDGALAAGAGTDCLFAPGEAEVYPPGFATAVEVSGLTEVLEGDPRARGPGHFRGVTTVVTKLLNMVGPDVVYFGQKDAQQALVVRRLVRDLDFPVRVEVLPTVRADDGLALSSRNAYLSRVDRERAAALARALRAAEEAVDAGERDAAHVLEVAREELERAAIEPEYLELTDPTNLSPLETIEETALLSVAARVGSARLIDNVLLEARSPAPELALASTPGSSSAGQEGDRTR